jgi:hypothetical protein
VREELALIFLTVGSFVPVVGWLVGVVLLWTSRRWTTGEKLAGTLLVPRGPGAVALVAGAFALTASSVWRCAGVRCTSGPDDAGLRSAVFVVAFVVPFVVAVVLFRRASRRARPA